MPDVGDRREVILAQAGKLFARKGVSATTVREIGEAAGILSGSLYHHFKSKEAMVDEILAEYLEHLQESYSQVRREHEDPKECLAGLIAASFHAIEAHRDACEIYQNDFNYLSGLPRFAYLKKRAAELQKAWVEVILAGVEQGELRSDVDPRVFYRFARDAVWLTVRWYKPGGRYRIEELADECTKILMEGYAEIGRSAQSTGPTRVTAAKSDKAARPAKTAKAVKTGSKAR
jgi:TetR/AcrR family transcriptional regulator, cholesterol catabolism regulator